MQSIGVDGKYPTLYTMNIYKQLILLYFFDIPSV